VNHRVALGTWWRCNDIVDRDPTSLIWRSEPRPLPSLSCEPHVRVLHVLPRVVLLDMEIEPDERKGDRYRFRARIGMLRGKSIDDVLVNEARSRMRERIVRKLVIGFLVGSDHRRRPVLLVG